MPESKRALRACWTCSVSNISNLSNLSSIRLISIKIESNQYSQIRQKVSIESLNLTVGTYLSNVPARCTRFRLSLKFSRTSTLPYLMGITSATTPWLLNNYPNPDLDIFIQSCLLTRLNVGFLLFLGSIRLSHATMPFKGSDSGEAPVGKEGQCLQPRLLRGGNNITVLGQVKSSVAWSKLLETRSCRLWHKYIA
jgi:hypothetical protein